MTVVATDPQLIRAEVLAGLEICPTTQLLDMISNSGIYPKSIRLQAARVALLRAGDLRQLGSDVARKVARRIETDSECASIVAEAKSFINRYPAMSGDVLTFLMDVETLGFSRAVGWRRTLTLRNGNTNQVLDINTHKAYNPEHKSWTAEIEYWKDGILVHTVSRSAPTQSDAERAAESEFNAITPGLLSQMWESQVPCTENGVV